MAESCIESRTESRIISPDACAETAGTSSGRLIAPANARGDCVNFAHPGLRDRRNIALAEQWQIDRLKQNKMTEFNRS